MLYLFSYHPLYLLEVDRFMETADQQGRDLLQAGKAKEAADVFNNKDWQAIANFKSGNYSVAFQQFNKKKTSDSQYNAGNSAAYLAHYQEAIDAYDKAIDLNPNNTDAIFNRDMIKKIMNEKKPDQNSSEKDATKPQTEKKPDSSKPLNETQKLDVKEQAAINSTSKGFETQDENKQQLLRRVAED